MLAAANLFGFLISLVEGAATAIGAGLVIGTFAGATAGLVNDWPRKQVERDALRDGYFGAMIALGIWVFSFSNV